MTGFGPSSIAPETTQFDPESAPLCTHTVQVPDLDLNPIQARRLYKEQLIQWLDKHNHLKESYRIENCGQTFVRLKCSGGHEKYARMHCNREYCPTCGQKGSRLHKKRTTRAMDRLIWAPVLGYLVFTLPSEISQSRPDVDTLKLLSKKAWEFAADHFETPGAMVRTHLMGNALGKFHIHINVLFPILNNTGKGMISRENLDRLRRSWTDFVNRQFDKEYTDTNVNYNFATTKRKIRHKIKYVVRPIVNALEFFSLKDEDKEYIISLAGWHNTRWFGKLANAQYKKFLTAKGINPKKYENADMYLSRLCPVCQNKYKMIEIIHKNNLPRGQLRYIDTDTLVDFSTYSYLKQKIVSTNSLHTLI